MSRLSSVRIGPRRVLGALVLLAAVSPIRSAATAVAVLPPGTPALHQSAELVSQGLGHYGRQGSDVALSADGSTLAVAATTWSHQRSSAVVVYVRAGDRWVTQTTLRSPPLDVDAHSDNWASDIAISADGDTLAVTDPTRVKLVRGAEVRGVVHLFTRSGQTWRATGQLVAPQQRTVSWFGNDVSISADGTRVLVGSFGRAYIADAVSHVVHELPRPATPGSFGYSLAISPDGRTAAVGAVRGITDPFPGASSVDVLVDDPVRGWGWRWHLQEQPGEGGSYFGAAVAVNDTETVVVGAPYLHRGVSVFDRRGTALVRTARFEPQYTRQAHSLGEEVAVSADGSTIVAGAPCRDAGASICAGAGYRWVRSPSGWAWGGLLSVAHPHPLMYEGRSVAMSADGRTVVLGAPGRTSPRLGETGAAIVFSASP